jgi:hypothetical protein
MVRFIVSLPFKRTNAVEELLVRCCLPRVRQHCRRRGWSLLALCIADEVDPDFHNARPDTLHLCRLELDRCLRLSAGPVILAFLDRTTSLVGTLPPSSIPEAEFLKWSDYVAATSQPTTQATPTHVASSAMPEHPGTHLLQRWYRQVRPTASGGLSGDFYLITPPDLAPPVDSIFAPEGKGRLTIRKRTQEAARELELLGIFLASNALPALYPSKVDALVQTMHVSPSTVFLPLSLARSLLLLLLLTH